MRVKIKYGLVIVLIFAALLGCVFSDRIAEQKLSPTPTIRPSPTPPIGPATATPPQPSPTPPIGSATATPPAPSPTPPEPTDSDPNLQREAIEAPPPLPPDVDLWREPVQEADRQSVEALAQARIPARDLRDLAVRLRGVDPNTPSVVSQASPNYPVGTIHGFKVPNEDANGSLIIEAELRYATEHLYMWVERGVSIDQGPLEAAAETFEADIYPTNRAFFGSEWTPGVDGDPHLSVLHARHLGSDVAGFYWSADEYVVDVRPDSNQMEIFYINADYADVGSTYYLGTLAHEFQHMIHWYNDRNEETWLNEGCSELAAQINGLGPSGYGISWSTRPDTQLTTWSDDAGTSAHYAAAYLFMSYFLDRFGETMTQALVAHPANGVASVDAVLAQAGAGLTFEDVFADWLIATYLDDPSLEAGRFDYGTIDPATPLVDDEHASYPVERTSQVAQHGADYVYLQGGQDLTLDFYGATRARLLPAAPHSGDFVWYSNRGDDCDMRLTRPFDLRGLDQATLRFWTWYDIETGWDYGYVQVSNDDGDTWRLLRGPSTTDANPNSNNYGWAYTGSQAWIEEEIDLSAYAGQEILLRFEYVTDDALNTPGWLIDDVSIPELGYQDDVEAGPAGWLAEGFVRTNNAVPQRYLVQLITFGAETSVRRLPLRADQTARWHLPLAQADHAILVISGLAPVTTEPSDYHYRLSVE